MLLDELLVLTLTAEGEDDDLELTAPELRTALEPLLLWLLETALLVELELLRAALDEGLELLELLETLLEGLYELLLELL